MDDKKKNIDFWSGAAVELSTDKAIKALQEKVSAEVAANPDFWQDAPRLTVALATKPRTQEGKAEQSIFQAFKGVDAVALKKAGVKLDNVKGTVTFTGFEGDASGMADLDKVLVTCGALRRTTATRCKGWPHISDPVLASTPKLAPTDRVGSIPGAKQISIALPPPIARALPSWASASTMVGFFVECGVLGITQHDLAVMLEAEKDKAEKDKANNGYQTARTLDEADVILVNTGDE